MKYPVNIEKYIKALRLEFGPNENAEEAHRVIVPFISACYEDGLRGESGYPLELRAELQAFSTASGRDMDHIRGNPLFPPLIRWGNEAYEQGRNDAKEAAE